ncbi:hypothetical protein AHAS_Ahas20G0238600 [Arachis hypogaea]
MLLKSKLRLLSKKYGIWPLNQKLPTYLDKIFHPVVAVILFVTFVLAFGEVIPQAICSRYGLYVGSNFVGLVQLYGELHDLNKQEIAIRYGKEQVHEWRRSYDTPPPNGESLKMCAEREVAYFRDQVSESLILMLYVLY